jgi:hypothetical protein
VPNDTAKDAANTAGNRVLHGNSTSTHHEEVAHEHIEEVVIEHAEFNHPYGAHVAKVSRLSRLI